MAAEALVAAARCAWKTCDASAVLATRAPSLRQDHFVTVASYADAVARYRMNSGDAPPQLLELFVDADRTARAFAAAAESIKAHHLALRVPDRRLTPKLTPRDRFLTLLLLEATAPLGVESAPVTGHFSRIVHQQLKLNDFTVDKIVAAVRELRGVGAACPLLISVLHPEKLFPTNVVTVRKRGSAQPSPLLDLAYSAFASDVSAQPNIFFGWSSRNIAACIGSPPTLNRPCIFL